VTRYWGGTNDMKKFFIKKTIIISTIAISIALIIGAYFLINHFIDKISGNLEAKRNQNQIETINRELTKEPLTGLKPADYYSETNIFDIMHRMANTKIIARDGEIWGRLEMDKDRIQTLKETSEKIDYPDREYLLETLSKWEKGDFSQCVEEHNYFWNKLGGTIGEAYKLKE
jgi:hypothetical protein